LDYCGFFKKKPWKPTFF